MINAKSCTLLRGGLLGVLAATTLSACSSLGLPTLMQASAIDVMNDDLGGIVLAVNSPDYLVPIPDRSHLTVGARLNDGTSDSVEADLVRAENADIFAQLPAPGNGRSFFLLEITEASQAELLAFQARMRPMASAAGGPGGAFDIGLGLAFCVTGLVDINAVTLSGYAMIPGKLDLAPIIENMALTDLLGPDAETDLPLCAEVL